MAFPEQKHPAGAPGEWKPPNFFLIVILSAVFIVLALVTAYVFMRKDGRHLMPQTQQSVPSQN